MKQNQSYLIWPLELCNAVLRQWYCGAHGQRSPSRSLSVGCPYFWYVVHLSSRTKRNPSILLPKACTARQTALSKVIFTIQILHGMCWLVKLWMYFIFHKFFSSKERYKCTWTQIRIHILWYTLLMYCKVMPIKTFLGKECIIHIFSVHCILAYYKSSHFNTRQVGIYSNMNSPNGNQVKMWELLIIF